jgi:hypothetical protein
MMCWFQHPKLDWDFISTSGGAEISKKIDWLLPNTIEGTPFEKYVRSTRVLFWSN